MPETSTEIYYRPEAVVDAAVVMLRAALTAKEVDARVEAFMIEPYEPPLVNVFAGAPEILSLSLAGPSQAAIELTCRSIATQADMAIFLGSHVRWAWGKDRSGRLINPITVTGARVIDAETFDGHLDTTGAAPAWVELVRLVYQSTSDILTGSES